MNSREPIRFDQQCDLNEIDENGRHASKQTDPRTSALPGITIDFSEEDRNARNSIRVNREFDSDEIDASDVQNEKQND
jgi:hypothetical protein